MSYTDNRCETPGCRHHKTKHRWGHSQCRVAGCVCTEFHFFSPAEREKQEAEQAAQQARYEEENRKAEEARQMRLATSPIDIFRFDSFTALMADTENKKPLNAGNEERYRAIVAGSAQQKRSQWAMEEDMTAWCESHGYGLHSIGQFMLHGWDSGVQRLDEAFKDIRVPALTDVRRRGVWSDFGDTLSIDRLYAGNPRVWYTTKRRQKNVPPRLQILVQATMSWIVDASNAFWRGAVATALARAAVAVGYNVAVDTIQSVREYSHSEGGGDVRSGYLQIVRVKDYDAPLNVSTLCALTAHPACLRVITFAHGFANAPLKINMGWGLVYEPATAILRRRGLINSPNVLPIVVPQNLLDKTKANNWLQKTVADLEKRAEEGWTVDEAS